MFVSDRKFSTSCFMSTGPTWRETLGSLVDAADASDLRGAWQAENYITKGGQITYPVRGPIIFFDKEFAGFFSYHQRWRSSWCSMI
jgi:hypothetical protein